MASASSLARAAILSHWWIGLQLWAHCAAVSAQRSLQIAPPPAYYPRLLGGNNITGSPLAIGVVEAPTDAEKRLVMVRRTGLAPQESWAVAETVVSVPFAADVDLSNGYLLALPSGVLLCAYRHHNGTGADRVFRIQVSASSDIGVTWAQLATVTSGPVGVWEPLLFQFSSDDAQTVQIYYSAELTNLGEQDVVRQTSTDGGKTWGAVDARIHTPGSRNGMPGVVEVADGSAVIVFEGFWGPFGWNHFTVQSCRSFDRGATWIQCGILHAPTSSDFNSGSPQVAMCPGTTKIVAVFMTSDPSSSGSAWPDGAHIGIVSGHLNATNITAPIVFPSTASVVPTATTAYWPATFYDEAQQSLRVSYNPPDSSAQLTINTECID